MYHPEIKLTLKALIPQIFGSVVEVIPELFLRQWRLWRQRQETIYIDYINPTLKTINKFTNFTKESAIEPLVAEPQW